MVREIYNDINCKSISRKGAMDRIHLFNRAEGATSYPLLSKRRVGVDLSKLALKAHHSDPVGAA